MKLNTASSSSALRRPRPEKCPWQAGIQFLDKAAKASFPKRFSAAWLAEAGAGGLGDRLEGAINRPARLYLERPGKMLRPLITRLLLRAFGKPPGPYREILGAIELMEAATVSFDDIIDGSHTRRNGPATHTLYGTENSYLACQAAYNWAYRAFLSDGIDIEDWRRQEMLSSLSREIFAYGYGQAAELYWTARKKAPSPGQYLNMSWDRIRFLSFNGPLRIGALLGGASRASLPVFEAAGSWLGMAYHLHGDELNLFPRSGFWGKPLADDITGGRYTYIYLTAMELSDPGGRYALRKALGNRMISESGLKKAIEIVRASGAVEENRRMIGVFYRRAVKAIDSFPVRRGYKVDFKDLAHYMAYERKK